MKAFITVTMQVGVEIPDKYSVLGGWEPTVNEEEADALHETLWDDAVKAMEEKLTPLELWDDNYYIREITDEWGYILEKGG